MAAALIIGVAVACSASERQPASGDVGSNAPTHDSAVAQQSVARPVSPTDDTLRTSTPEGGAQHERTAGSASKVGRDPVHDDGRSDVGDSASMDAVPRVDGARDTSASGTVSVAGAVPYTLVVLHTDDRYLTLMGPLAPELARLHGMEVTVHGTSVASAEPRGGGRRAIMVASYTIEAIGGRKPVVGIVRRDTSGLWVDTTLLVAAPEALDALVGAKVWVTGTTKTDATLVVSAYGVLRPPAGR